MNVRRSLSPDRPPARRAAPLALRTRSRTGSVSRAHPGATSRPAPRGAPWHVASGARPRADAVGWPPDWLLLLVVVGLLTVIGLVMVLSASSVQSMQESGSTWGYFLRQAMWVGIGAVALVVATRVDYRWWGRVSKLLLVVSAVLLVAVLVPGLGLRINGARSWLGVGPLHFQPAELAKLAVVVFVADLLAARSRLMADSRATLRPVMAVMAVIVALMLLQPDLGTTVVVVAIAFAVLYVAGVPAVRLAGWAAVATAGSVVMAFAKPYRRNRLLAFVDPAGDPMSTGYQINQSLMGVSSGRITGLGLGESWAKWGFLPNAHTDFIFAILAEELGLIGALVVLGLLGAFTVLGVRTALHAPERFGTLLAAGVTAWVAVQALVNVGGVVGILPITGLTLPFISFGGSSVVVTMLATGILVNVARHGASRPVLAAVPSPSSTGRGGRSLSSSVERRRPVEAWVLGSVSPGAR